jgi:thiol:disulfide interchange protein/DsbC/DsbD-like thiol-disulfide interchange protein
MVGEPKQPMNGTVMILSILQWIKRAAPMLVALCAFMTVVASPAHAKSTRISATLMLESATPSAGQRMQVAIRMTPDAGWHGYWINGGDAGFGMQVEWNLPEGVTIGELQYPVPEALILFGMMNHVYEHPYALLADVTIDKNIIKGSDLTISGVANWLACTDKVCVPERAIISANMVAGDGQVSAEKRTQFDAWRAALPRPLDQHGRWERRGDALRFSIPLPESVALETPHLFIATDRVADYATAQKFSRNGQDIIVDWKPKGDAAGPIQGLLKLADGRGLSVRFDEGNVPPAGEVMETASDGATMALFWTALAGAVLGGLILNLMPCVFPILSLKALSLARSGGNAAEARVEALAYTAGAVVTALALGGLLLALRAGGEQVGWAFQLQHPLSVLILLLLASAITLNLAGVFYLASFGGGQKLVEKGGAAGGFWTGALAAFVATPCSGPLLGAALGATLALPAWAALPIFGGLGFGLALPFLAVGFVPALRRMLPKPGAWMDRFRKIMAVPMALTALGLIWLLWRQMGGGAGLALAGLALLLFVLLLWQWGVRQRVGGRGLVVALLGAATLAAVAAAGATFTKAERVSEAGGTKYSAAALAEARASGNAVFLYFTADWCLSCKANEAAAISREVVREAMEAAGIKILVADWTNGDPEITRALAEHGRNSVPLYLWYAPRAEAPEILPQILTPAMLIERAKSAQDAKGN